MISTVFAGIFTLALFQGASAAAWGYNSESGVAEPSQWADSFPMYCNFTRQSPIDIVTADVEYDSSVAGIAFANYDDAAATTTVTNNGHTATIDMTFTGTIPSISGGPMSEKYNLFSFHMHWGSDNTQGSEHTIDGQKFPAEIHFIHMKDSASSFANGATMSDGFVVLTFMFEVGTTENAVFNHFLDAFEQVRFEGNTTTNITALSLNEIMHSSRESYYTYEGGVTTPNCNEAARFVIFKQSIKVTAAQMTRLRTAMVFPEDIPMQNNYRPTQDVNGRVVKVSKLDDTDSGATSVSSMSLFLLLAMCLYNIFA